MGTAPATCPGEAAAHRYSLEMLDDEGRVCDLLWDVGNHQCPGDLGEGKGQRGWVMGAHGLFCCHPACPATRKAETRWGTDCHPGGWSARTSPVPAPRRWGTARRCHLPDRQT